MTSRPTSWKYGVAGGSLLLALSASAGVAEGVARSNGEVLDTVMAAINAIRNNDLSALSRVIAKDAKYQYHVLKEHGERALSIDAMDDTDDCAVGKRAAQADRAFVYWDCKSDKYPYSHVGFFKLTDDGKIAYLDYSSDAILENAWQGEAN